jgi:hypothetical protein
LGIRNLPPAKENSNEINRKNKSFFTGGMTEIISSVVLKTLCNFAFTPVAEK